jgi:hypothetical protein
MRNSMKSAEVYKRAPASLGTVDPSFFASHCFYCFKPRLPNMKFTHSALALLASCGTAHSLLRGSRILPAERDTQKPIALPPRAEVPSINDKALRPRQLSAAPTLSAITTPSSPFSIPSGTGFGGGYSSGTAPHHSHGTGRPSGPRGSASHHRGGGGRKTRSRKFPRQYPTITASSFGSSPTSTLSPYNETTSAFPSETSLSGGAPTGLPSFSGFPTASETGYPTGGHSTRRHSGTRHPHPTQTGPFPTLSFPFPSGSGSLSLGFPTTGFPVPSGTGAPSFSFPAAGSSFSASATESGYPSAAPTTFATVLTLGGY